jgi:hypothetical protein
MGQIGDRYAEVFPPPRGYQQVRTRLLLDSHGEGASRTFFAIRTKPTLNPAIVIQMGKLPKQGTFNVQSRPGAAQGERCFQNMIYSEGF